MSENGLTSGAEYVDSLVAHEFAVEIDGERASGVFTISGLVTFKVEESGVLSHPPIRISKMVQRDPKIALNKWIKETRETGGKATRTLVILAIDDGVEIRRWTFSGARIREIGYSTFDSGSTEMVSEALIIVYDSLQESWAGG
jgi:hypothetical protein